MNTVKSAGLDSYPPLKRTVFIYKCSIIFFFTEVYVYNLGFLQLKYHDTGREKDCLPQVGQWNMMNKVI